ADDSGVARAAVAQPFADPAAQQLIIARLAYQAAPAAVGHLPRALQQQERLFWRSRQEAPATRLVHQGIVIRDGVEPKHRELEAVLPACLTMAAARIASRLGRRRHDFVWEVDRRLRRSSRHEHPDRAREALPLDVHGGTAIAYGGHHTGGTDNRNPGV